VRVARTAFDAGHGEHEVRMSQNVTKFMPKVHGSTCESIRFTIRTEDLVHSTSVGERDSHESAPTFDCIKYAISQQDQTKELG
jgi:hypothetical protein